MTTDQNLLDILRCLAPHAKFRFNDGPELTAEQYRFVWTSAREKAELVRPRDFDRLLVALGDILSPFTETDQNGQVFVLEHIDGIVTRTYMFGGPGTPLAVDTPHPSVQ